MTCIWCALLAASIMSVALFAYISCSAGDAVTEQCSVCPAPLLCSRPQRLVPHICLCRATPAHVVRATLNGHCCLPIPACILAYKHAHVIPTPTPAHPPNIHAPTCPTQTSGKHPGRCTSHSQQHPHFCACRHACMPMQTTHTHSCPTHPLSKHSRRCTPHPQLAFAPASPSCAEPLLHQPAPASTDAPLPWPAGNVQMD